MNCFNNIDIRDYKEIGSNLELNGFWELVGSFHDGVLKEIHMLNQAYVDSNLCMSYQFAFNARMLIQRQWADPSAVEFILVGVTQIAIGNNDMIFKAKGEVKTDSNLGTTEIILNFDGNRIICSKLYYRDASDWMGKEHHF